MTGKVNPTTFTITDPSIAAQNVAGFQIQLGQTQGGPYPLTAQVPAADINAAAGICTGTIASLGQNLAPGQWYAVAEAINAAGDSLPSPEVAFMIEAVPSAPTGFSVS